MLPPDHSQRRVLSDEVHARPPVPLAPPARASYLALLVDAPDRPREIEHIAGLCERYGVPGPDPSATHFFARLGEVRLKWEKHGEFSGFTFFTDGLSPEPFSEPVASLLPEGWLAGLPGRTIVAAHAKLVQWEAVADEATSAVPDAALLSRHFGTNIPVGADIGEGAGCAFTDFRIHADGFSRFLVMSRSFTPRQAGRMLQRLFEVEVYRVLALLALPIARELGPRTLVIEGELAQLTDQIAGQARDDEALLHALTGLAAEVESALAASQFRFGACRAYHELATTRIAELRERRLPGIQTIEEFMARRLTPAVATCATVSQRLHGLSERVAQASGLLATRVGIARERQNQALLSSMDRRAKLQLRLQQTVEGLSVAAIVYYVAGLFGYLAKGAKAGGLHLDTDLAVAIALPVLALVVILALRRARRRLHTDPAADSI